MSKEKVYFETLVTQVDNAELGQMFGKPCGKINKKAFVAFFQDEMVFKIGRAEAPLVIQQYEGAQNWDPSGKKRPMKDWIQIPAEYQEQWEAFTQQALDFVVQENRSRMQ